MAWTVIWSGCGGDPPSDLFPSDAGTDAAHTDEGVRPCTSDSDCSGGETCQVGACIAPPSTCSKNSDCSSRSDGNKVCDTVAKLCVQCTSAADCGTAERCVNSICTAGVKCHNSLDCPGDQVCDSAIQFCVACVTDVDCGHGQRCASNVCRAACASDKDCIPLGELCDTAAGYCVICVSSDDCASDQYCNQGACAGDLCAAGSSHCEGNAVVGCNAEGSGMLAPVSCRPDQTCTERGGTASCHDWICPPLVAGCEATGEKAWVCSADGLTQTVTDDCGAKNQVCVAAACKPVVCEANSSFCVGSELRRCSGKGDSSMTLLTCTSTEYCDNAADACKSQICAPSQPACNGAISATCNATGSGYVAGGIDCASSGQICFQGHCSDLACVPNGKFCDQNTVRQCSANGLSSTVYQTCSSSQYCDPASAACKAQICAPNQPACNGTVATTCNATGSGYLAGGMDCAISGQTCAEGACKATVCTPNAQFCEANAIRQCSADGTSSTLHQACSASQYCDAAGPSCKADICAPGQPACNGNIATTCNANGSGFTGTGTNCSSSSQFCSEGQCIACTRVQGSQWVRTRYASYTPKNVTMTDGAAQIAAIAYAWVGWFEYDVTFPMSGNYRIRVHLADDGWHEGASDALYNHIQVLVDGTQHLAFDANTTAYDDGQRASGDQRFHNTTGAAFSASAASHVVHFENIADAWTGGDDLTLYVAYFDICSQ